MEVPLLHVPPPPLPGVGVDCGGVVGASVGTGVDTGGDVGGAVDTGVDAGGEVGGDVGGVVVAGVELPPLPTISK